MSSKTEVGGVAMCEGNPKLFVKTAEGWLRAEVSVNTASGPTHTTLLVVLHTRHTASGPTHTTASGPTHTTASGPTHTPHC